MPRSPADTQTLKDARKTEILCAASRVFAKKGFAAAKISDIAREAGLSHGLVYHYYENKDAVFGAILEDKLAHMREAMAEDEARPGTSLVRMEATMKRWLERTQAEPEMGLMIAQALLSDSLCQGVRSMMQAHARWSFTESVKRIREGQERGEISTHAPPEELATSLMCVMRGLALTTLVDSGIPFSPPSVGTVMRLLLPSHALLALDQEERGAGAGLKKKHGAGTKKASSSTKTEPSAKTKTKTKRALPTKAPRKVSR